MSETATVPAVGDGADGETSTYDPGEAKSGGVVYDAAVVQQPEFVNPIGEETVANTTPVTDEPVVPAGTVAETMRWVGEDPERAQAALDVEQEATKPRSTLLVALAPVIALGAPGPDPLEVAGAAGPGFPLRGQHPSITQTG